MRQMGASCWSSPMRLQGGFKILSHAAVPARAARWTAAMTMQQQQLQQQRRICLAGPVFSTAATPGAGLTGTASAPADLASSLQLPEFPAPLIPFHLPPVHLEYDMAKLEVLIQKHVFDAGARAVGFDIEWRPTGSIFKGDGRPALLQLATPQAVILVPLQHLKARPKLLIQLLMKGLPASSSAAGVAGPAFLCGVAAGEDLSKLELPLTSSGSSALSFDISTAAWRAGLIPGNNKEFRVDQPPRDGPAPSEGSSPDWADMGTPAIKGLANMVSALGGPELKKPKKVQMSDWAKRTLSPEQIKYAALDAYAGVWVAERIYEIILDRAASASLAPPLPYFEWMLAEARTQAAEDVRRAEVKAMVLKATVDCLRRLQVKREPENSMSIKQLAAAVRAAAPDIGQRSDRQLGFDFVGMAKRGTIARDMTDGPDSSIRYQLP